MSASNVEMIQLKIMYLFMNADGMCEEIENERFNAICEELKASEEDKNEISEFIKGFDFSEREDNSEVVIRAIGILLGYIKENNDGEDQNNVINSSSASFGALHAFCAASKQLSQTLGQSVSAHLINKNKVRQAHTIWTLINLGYADSMLVPSEQKVIDYLISIWEMDDVLTRALFDTAETILALQAKKDWILSTDKTEEEIDELCNEIDKEIKKMYIDVELTISEANI